MLISLGVGGQSGVAYTFFINADKNNAADLIAVLNTAGQEVPDALQIMSDKWALEKPEKIEKPSNNREKRARGF